MLRGEVWLVNLDPTPGAEIKKTRHAVIVNADAVGIFTAEGDRFYQGGMAMTLKADEIEAEALKLSPDARARLAERLLRSLEGLSDEENEALWIQEAQRRNQEMDAGSTVGRPSKRSFGTPGLDCREP
jgi:hypothetical protein